MSETAISTTVPAPVLGWNTAQPVDSMSPLYALQLDNMFPEEQALTLRRGHELYASGLGADDVETLASHTAADGTETFLAGCAGNIWNVSTSTPSSLKSTGITSDRWQVINMGDFIIFVNGLDQPQKWDGSTLNDATYTGISDDADLIQGCNYRNRVYFCAVGSGSIWYGDVNSVQGELTEYPVNYAFANGGYPLFVATWSQLASDFASDRLVVVSNKGEVILHEGANPESNDFRVSSRVFLARPLGRRAYYNLGSDLEIMTRAGIVSLAQAVSAQIDANVESNLTANIRPTFNEAARTAADEYHWQAVYYDNRRAMIYNVPRSSLSAHQYVRNVQTGAWCRYTGMNGFAWANYGDHLYFGAASGNIYKADATQADNGANISLNVRHAYNYLDDRRRIKHLVQAMPILEATAEVTLSFGVDVDFKNLATLDTIEVSGSTGQQWDTFTWLTWEWADASRYITDWYSIAGLGRAASLKCKADVRNLDLRYTATHVNYKMGGYI